MDENIHLYFENQEVCLRFKKQGKKLYVVDNLKFVHHGTQSSDPSLKFDTQSKVFNVPEEILNM